MVFIELVVKKICLFFLFFQRQNVVPLFRLNKAELPEGVDLIVVPRGPSLTFEQACCSLTTLARAVARRLSVHVAKSSP